MYERAELQNKWGSRFCQFPRWNKTTTSSCFFVALLDMTTLEIQGKTSSVLAFYWFFFYVHKDKSKSVEIMVMLSDVTLSYTVQELMCSQTHPFVTGLSLLSLFLQILPPQSGCWSWGQEGRIQSPSQHLSLLCSWPCPGQRSCQVPLMWSSRSLS